MNINTLKDGLLSFFIGKSVSQKISCIYALAIITLCIFLPIIRITSINSNDIMSYGIFGSGMGRVSILVGILLLLIFLRNFVPQWKNRIYRAVGFSSDDHFIHAVLLFGLLSMYYSIGDTLNFLGDNFSGRLETTMGFHIITITLALGVAACIRQAIISTKKEHKQTHDVHTGSTVDQSQTEAFKKIEQEFGGLFK